MDCEGTRDLNSLLNGRMDGDDAMGEMGCPCECDVSRPWIQCGEGGFSWREDGLPLCLVGGYEKSGLERAIARMIGLEEGTRGLTADDYRERYGGWIDLPTGITHEPFRECKSSARRRPLGAISHGEFRKGSSGEAVLPKKPVVSGKDDDLEAKRRILMEAWKSMNGGEPR